MHLPPLTTFLALARSGLSDLVSSWLTNTVKSVAQPSTGTGSGLADPPSRGAASKLVPLIVRTLTESLAVIVWRALPAEQINYKQWH